MTLKVGSLFAGYGGLDSAVCQHYGAQVAWFCEFDKHPSAILAHHYPDVPNYGDVTAVDWSRVEPVDIITGGFPCQDVSHAGLRRGVHQGTRSGLWFEMARAIDQLKPWKVVIENVAGLLSADAACNVEPCPWCLGDEPAGHMRALGAVLADLAEMGFDAEWGSVRASDVGAPHRRDRLFIVAADAGGGQLARPAVSADGLPVAGERGGDPDGLTLLPTPTSRDWKGRNQRDDTTCLPGAIDRIEGPREADAGSGEDGCNCRREWGPYAPAIHRWEIRLRRLAPPPTEPGKDGRPRLSPRAVEFLMGLPDGWVTGVGIPRSAQLKALGNGVVPQQCKLALELLDPR